MQSRASQRSKNSHVDESLFGGKAKAATKNQVVTSTGVISLNELRSIREKAFKNNQTDAVVISKDELSRIKNETVVKTKRDLENEKKAALVARENKHAAAKARKARI